MLSKVLKKETCAECRLQSLGNATVSERGYGFTGKEGQSGCV